jgi:sec-independent protein translocase protein TatA
MPNIGPFELLIVLVIALLIFGGTKIPKLARSLGQAQKEFKAGLDEGAKDEPSPNPGPKDGEKGQ